MHVLVTGATGFVGRHLVPPLLEAGHEVLAMVRDATAYDPPEGVDLLEADLTEPDDVRRLGGADTATSLADALSDVDAAYYLVHSMRAGGDFESRDRDLARSYAQAASDAGIDRTVYLGGLGEEGQDLSRHLRSRREVERILADGSYDLTTLRAAIVVGAGSAGFEVVRQLATRLPIMITPRWVRTPCQPIAIDDAVAYLAGVLDAPETAGETFGIGGPEVLTYETMIRRVGELAGTRPWIVPVPVLSPGLSAYWVSLVTDVDTSVARPLIDGLKTPVVVGESSIDEHVHVDKTSFEDAVRRALAAEDRAE